MLKTGLKTVFAVSLIFLLYFLAYYNGKNAGNSNARAKEIVSSFDDVDWGKQSFVCGGAKMETVDGQRVFYKAKDIDDAIKKLNNVLGEMKI